MLNRRNGKVARLPEAVRQTVNNMLADGVTYKNIIQTLQDLGYPNFNKVNIHQWKNGGYRDFQVQQERLASIRALLGNEPPLQDVGSTSLKLAAHQYHQILTEFDPDYLGECLAKHPERYFQLILSYSRLLKNRLTLAELLRDERHRKDMAAWIHRKEAEQQRNRESNQETSIKK